MKPEPIIALLGLKGKSIPITGGDVNHNFRIKTADKSYFLKLHPGVASAFFEAEITGLQTIAPYVRTPNIERTGVTAAGAYLLMEWIEPGFFNQEEAASALTQLHRITQTQFGFKEDNYIGILPQVNAKTKDWLTFFLTCRLDVQTELAKLNNRWTSQREERYQRLKVAVQSDFTGLDFIPSLLHGDFWRGNVLFDQKGRPVFIDPAVSFGHREMDIAMSQLFGGFREEFLHTYQDLFPLEDGWQERLPVYQLYYLLAHLNMFGESYGGAVDMILSKY